MDKKQKKNNVRVIGLTGGIGTGKSTVADYLKSKGFYHIDADEIGKRLTEKGSPMLEKLNRVFGHHGELGEAGTEILNSDGSLNRKALASIAFSSRVKKERLDSIMLASIIEEIDEECRELKEKLAFMGGNILIDAPLLFEAGLDDRCDKTLLVVTALDVRIKRVCERDGATEQEVMNRINCQMSDEEKLKRADMVVDNSGTIDELYSRLDEIVKEMNRDE